MALYSPRYILIIAAVLASIRAAGQVPKMGNDTLLDIACWNIEWFGDVTNGPSDETSQFNNVKKVLLATDIDVWALEEVSDASAWNALISALPSYSNTITTYSQTQKTALIWKSNMFDLVSTGSVLSENQYSYSFASRPPLEVVLKTRSPVPDTIYFYVVHLKAYADQESYNRRRDAAGFLKTFLDANRAGKKVMVLGDWNDDLNSSIYSNSVSPFINLVNDSSSYFFPTKQLCDQHKSSYVSGSKMLDEQMISVSLKPFYMPGSCRIIDELPTYISGYSGNTSDHYPVLSFLNLKRYPAVGINEVSVKGVRISVYPNPASGNVVIRSDREVEALVLMDQLGQIMPVSLERDLAGTVNLVIDSRMQDGIYFLHIQNGNSVVTVRLGIQR